DERGDRPGRDGARRCKVREEVGGRVGGRLRRAVRPSGRKVAEVAMPGPDRRIDLAWQLRAHLESLRAAGVQFVPCGEPLALLPQRGADAPRSPEPEPPPDPLAERRRELTVLAGEVAGCDLCPELFSTRSQTVFG